MALLEYRTTNSFKTTRSLTTQQAKYLMFQWQRDNQDPTNVKQMKI